MAIQGLMGAPGWLVPIGTNNLPSWDKAMDGLEPLGFQAHKACASAFHLTCAIARFL